MKQIDKIALIYVKNNKVLVTLSKGKTVYYFPGGKRENNETDIETLCREIKEELSVDIVKDSVNLYGTFEAQADGKTEGVIVKMTCYVAEFNGDLKPNSEIEKYDWFDYSSVERVSVVDKIIFEKLRDDNLIR